MAKFYVTYKDPDGPYDGMSEAKRKIPAGDVERVCDKFGIGEYITMELDTVAMTCTLVPEKYRSRESDEYYAELNREWQEEKEAEEEERRKWDAVTSSDPGQSVPARKLSDITHPTLDDKGWQEYSDPTIDGEQVQRIPIKFVKGSN